MTEPSELLTEAADIARAFDDVFDQALVFHAFTPYNRDYEVIVHSVADPRTGIVPTYQQYLFRSCVEATTRTALPPETWRVSVDDRLVTSSDGDDAVTGERLGGFVWGVRWQPLYPGMQLVVPSERAFGWSRRLERRFHEATIGTNTHLMSLVFAELQVRAVPAGYAPFTAG